MPISPVIWAVTFILVFIPHCFDKPLRGEKIHVGLPHVLNGDEPHYLLSINSLVYDGDLDLHNNYLASHHGSLQAGIRFAKKPLNHQTYFKLNGKQRSWIEFYDRWKWTIDSSGFPAPVPIVDDISQAAFSPEYSVHPPGMAFVLAPFIFFFKAVPFLIEPLSLALTGAAVFFIFVFLSLLLRRFTPDRPAADIVASIIVLGSPLWHYGRVLYTEAFLALFAVAAFTMVIRYQKYFFAGVFIGLGMLMKPFFIVLLAPLVLALLYHIFSSRRFFDLKKIVVIVAPAVVAAIVQMCLNKAMFGSYRNFCQVFEFGNFFEGSTLLWVSTQRGIIWTCPLALLSLIAWPAFFRKFGGDALALILGFAIYFSVIAINVCPSGGDVFGPRLIIPVLPLLLISLIRIPSMHVWKNRFVRAVMIAIVTVSIGMNAASAILSWQFLNRSPLIVLVSRLGLHL